MNHRILLSAGLSVFLAGAAYGQCKSDSSEQYQSDVESCNANYASPHDAADLRSCVDSAYNDFAESYDDCDNTAPFYKDWQQELSKLWSGMTEWSTADPPDKPKRD